MKNIGLYYDKIIRSIQSSKNELHLRTCSTMIAMFYMKFVEYEDQTLIESFETQLKNEFDRQAVKLGLLTL